MSNPLIDIIEWAKAHSCFLFVLLDPKLIDKTEFDRETQQPFEVDGQRSVSLVMFNDDGALVDGYHCYAGEVMVQTREQFTDGGVTTDFVYDAIIWFAGAYLDEHGKRVNVHFKFDEIPHFLETHE